MNLDLVDSDLYKVKSLKKHITFDLLLQVDLFVYSLAKLKILEFVYDCIKKYIPDDCFEFIEMDTDSLYFSLCSNSLEKLVKPELREQFFENYDYFFPSLACEHHKKQFVKARVQNLEWIQEDCCKAHELFDRGPPWLFMLEFFGHEMISLAPKTYFCEKVHDQGLKKSPIKQLKKLARACL